MYIPEISGTACGAYNPPLTEWEREDALDIEYVIDTMNCLYSRDFKPLYVEGDCPCITCYDKSTWSRITQHSGIMNHKNIWNDIIKRWEPTEFDQVLSEDIAEISGYEFRPFESIYGHPIEAYDGNCSKCYPMDESVRGIGFIKAFDGYDVVDADDTCCLCTSLNPTIVLTDVDGNIINNIPLKGYSISGAYSLAFSVAPDIIDNITKCGDRLWYGYIDDHPLNNVYGNYSLSGNSGTIIIKFYDVNDPALTFECRYEWGITFN